MAIKKMKTFNNAVGVALAQTTAVLSQNSNIQWQNGRKIQKQVQKNDTRQNAQWRDFLEGKKKNFPNQLQNKIEELWGWVQKNYGALRNEWPQSFQQQAEVYYLSLVAYEKELLQTSGTGNSLKANAFGKMIEIEKLLEEMGSQIYQKDKEMIQNKVDLEKRQKFKFSGQFLNMVMGKLEKLVQVRSSLLKTENAEEKKILDTFLHNPDAQGWERVSQHKTVEQYISSGIRYEVFMNLVKTGLLSPESLGRNDLTLRLIKILDNFKGDSTLQFMDSMQNKRYGAVPQQ